MQDTSHHEHIATRSERLQAFILEIIVVLGPVFILVLLDNWLFKGYRIGRESPIELLGGTIILCLIVLQILLTPRRSQTIGKYLLDLQVVRSDTEKRIGFWRYILLREFVGKTLVIGALPLIGIIFQPIYLIVDYLFIFRKDKRTLHDFIARTKVIHLPVEKRAKAFLDFSKLP